MKLTQTNSNAESVKANLFFTGILAIIITILWIATSVYGAYTTNKTDAEIESLLTPIDPTLDLDVLREYRDSRTFPPSEFEIVVVKTEGQKTSTSILNPFTGTTTESIPSAPEPEPSPETAE